jgi:hypothetical protein
MGLQQDNQNKEAMRVLITYRRIYYYFLSVIKKEVLSS